MLLILASRAHFTRWLQHIARSILAIHPSAVLSVAQCTQMGPATKGCCLLILVRFVCALSETNRSRVQNYLDGIHCSTPISGHCSKGIYIYSRVTSF